MCLWGSRHYLPVLVEMEIGTNVFERQFSRAHITFDPAILDSAREIVMHGHKLIYRYTHFVIVVSSKKMDMYWMFFNKDKIK